MWGKWHIIVQDRRRMDEQILLKAKIRAHVGLLVITGDWTESLSLLVSCSTEE